MYQVDGNDGFVKIGFTSKPIQQRLDEWEADCNRKPRLLYPLPSAGAKPILHAAHVEALCHAELNWFRARIECKTCIKQHIEWFKVSPDDVALEQVIAVVRKWWWWMGTCPYQKDPETGWGLKKKS